MHVNDIFYDHGIVVKNFDYNLSLFKCNNKLTEKAI